MNYKLFNKVQSPNIISSSDTWYKVGLPAGEDPRLFYEIEKGFNAEIIQVLAKELNWPIYKILKLIRLSRSTYYRRLERHRLTSQESEVITRIIRVYEATISMFSGDKASALQWLEEPVVALANEKPVELLRSESGANDIIKLIHRLMYGVYI